jgi:hypothetical protein
MRICVAISWITILILYIAIEDAVASVAVMSGTNGRHLLRGYYHEDDEYLPYYWQNGCGPGIIDRDIATRTGNVGVRTCDYTDCCPCKDGYYETDNTFVYYGKAVGQKFTRNQCTHCPKGEVPNYLKIGCEPAPPDSTYTGTVSPHADFFPWHIESDTILPNLVNGYNVPSSYAVVVGSPPHAKIPVPYAIRPQRTIYPGDTSQKGLTVPWYTSAESAESHGYDSIIAASTRSSMSCDTDCNFNELFICPNLGKWHSFKHKDMSANWFRNVQESAWDVKNWRYLKTYNENVVVTLRYGNWDSSCVSKIDSGATTKQLKRSNWEQYDVEFDDMYWTYTSDSDITCMKVENIDPGSTSCDIALNTVGDHTFLRNRWFTQGGIAISLPAKYERNVWTENAVFTEISSLYGQRVITECHAGYYEFHMGTVTNYWTSKCIAANTLYCQQIDAEQTTSDCRNEAIFFRCIGELPGREFERCFKDEVMKCRTLMELKDPPRLSTYIYDACEDLSRLCDDPNFDDRFFDLETNQCEFCEPTGPTGGTLGNGRIEDGYKCEGAYGGRHECLNDNWMDLISDAPASGHMLETVYTDGANGRKYNFKCYPCTKLDIQNNEIADENSCTSKWTNHLTGSIQFSLGIQFELVSHGTTYSDCTQVCLPGEYAKCQEKPPGCGRCSCVDSCRGGDNFCLIDYRICNGEAFENDGASCIPIDAVSCDIGYVLDKSRYNDKFSDSLQTFSSNSSTVLKEWSCSYCMHPSGEYCSTGTYWPGCLEEGLKDTPQCRACENTKKPDNSVWRVRQEGNLFDECTWECEEDFYKSGAQCVSCTKQNCGYDHYRPYCPQGTTQLPICIRCMGLQPPNILGCELGEYERKCSGTGYRAGDNTSIECTQCKTEEQWNCPLDAPFQPCNMEQPYADNSACIRCNTIGSAQEEQAGILEYTDECEFDCNVSYYRETRAVNELDNNDGFTVVYNCILCETNPSEVCDSCEFIDNCNEAYELEKCDNTRRTNAPECYCKPGHGYLQQSYGPVVCTECVGFQSSNGYNDTCTLCPGGYSGATEKGSHTCQACPVDTFRAYRSDDDNFNYGGCEPCEAGTNGLTASKTCKLCSNGLMAILVDWEGYLWNYQNDSWTYWNGFPPNQCIVRGMGPDLTICTTIGSREDIKYISTLADTIVYSVDSIEVEFVCGECSGGLAYATNFDYTIAGHTEANEL